jgi:hypothetical protein
MKDFVGRTIVPGDVIAMVETAGYAYTLSKRYVRSVHEDHIKVHHRPVHEEVDPRTIGRIKRTRNCIVLT